MNGKIVTLEYISPRCACGRDLPKGRSRWCYHCRPPRGFRCQDRSTLSAEALASYTLDDRAAQAEAYGLSYGQLMAFVENNWPMPPRIKPIRWPLGSVHYGEEK